MFRIIYVDVNGLCCYRISLRSASIHSNRWFHHYDANCLSVVTYLLVDLVYNFDPHFFVRFANQLNFYLTHSYASVIVHLFVFTGQQISFRACVKQFSDSQYQTASLNSTKFNTWLSLTIDLNWPKWSSSLLKLTLYTWRSNKYSQTTQIFSQGNVA